MKIFCDLHHHDLYYSLQLLFEKRLGAEMYRPIGLEWYERKFWNVYPHIDTAKQYLGLDQAINPPKDIHGNYLSDREQLNKYYRFEDGIYYVRDTTKDKVQRGITMEKFQNMEFDILISSIPQHIAPFNQLISRYQPKAKHIFQVGNRWGQQAGVKNILSSTSPFAVPSDINACFYHQEFDLDVFQYTEPTNDTVVHSYIHYMQRPELLRQYHSSCPDWKVTMYGAGMEGCFHKTADIAKSMSDSAWTWHYKPGGDGYGHILHNSYACGRPVIIDGTHYRGQCASYLFEDGVNCIDISRRSFEDNVRLLQAYKGEEHKRMCEAAYTRFKAVVNFDEEEQKIRKFLENLK